MQHWTDDLKNESTLVHGLTGNKSATACWMCIETEGLMRSHHKDIHEFWEPQVTPLEEANHAGWQRQASGLAVDERMLLTSDKLIQ